MSVETLGELLINDLRIYVVVSNMLMGFSQNLRLTGTQYLHSILFGDYSPVNFEKYLTFKLWYDYLLDTTNLVTYLRGNYRIILEREYEITGRSQMGKNLADILAQSDELIARALESRRIDYRETLKEYENTILRK